MHILLAAGGTAGHINPALAAAQRLLHSHPDCKISYIGNRAGMEARLVPQAGTHFYPIDVAGFQRKLSLENIKRNVDAFYKMFASTKQAERLLRELKPDVAVGFGGYVSGPVIRKAAKMGIKTATHEQNAFPGMTTKALSKLVDVVMLAMPEAQRYLPAGKRYVHTGNPVRQPVLDATRSSARKALGIPEDALMLLSFGGSLGARRINEAVAELLAWHKGKYYHYHAIGKYGMDWMPALLREKGVDYPHIPTLRITEYINDMDRCMAAADLVVCRAGAITLAELQAVGKPSILIPSPNVAENHQYYNAKTLADKNAAVLIEEKELTGQGLIETVKQLFENPKKLAQMGKNAARDAVLDANERIYRVLMELYASR